MRGELRFLHVRYVIGSEFLGFAERPGDLFLRNATEKVFGGRLPPVGHIEVERVGKPIRVIDLCDQMSS